MVTVIVTVLVMARKLDLLKGKTESLTEGPGSQ